MVADCWDQNYRKNKTIAIEVNSQREMQYQCLPCLNTGLVVAEIIVVGQLMFEWAGEKCCYIMNVKLQFA